MTPLGQCISGCVNERIVDPNPDGTWPPDPADDEGWAYTPDACDPETYPGFYFDSPDILDTKVYIEPDDWDTIAVGTVIREYKQWVRLKVPKCHGDPPHRYVGGGPYHFKIKKHSATTVIHEKQ